MPGPATFLGKRRQVPQKGHASRDGARRSPVVGWHCRGPSPRSAPKRRSCCAALVAAGDPTLIPKKRKKRATPVVAPIRRTAPKTHHLDRRAGDIVAANSGSEGDVLLTTREAADFLRVSQQWLEIGRHRGYGPPYQRVGPRLIFYNRRPMLDWLNTRTHRCTSEYMEAPRGR